MEAILVNYNYSPDWLLDYPELKPVTIFDRSDDGVNRNLERFGKVIKTPNVGQVDADKLGYLIDNYDNLPNVFLLAKANLFKSITKEEFDKGWPYTGFTPLLTQNHKTYSDNLGVVCYYEGGMYLERNNSWFFNELPSKHYRDFPSFARDFWIPNEPYIKFAPGGNYVLTREVIHKYSRDYYQRMRDLLPYAENPAEAHCLERSYYYIWS